jgi:hypothetical protein
MWMQSEHGIRSFSYEMQRELWLPSGFSSASLKTSWRTHDVIFRVHLLVRCRYLILSGTSSPSRGPFLSPSPSHSNSR